MPTHHHIVPTSDAFTVETTLRPLRHLPTEYIDIGGGLHATASAVAAISSRGASTLPVISAPAYEVRHENGDLVDEVEIRYAGEMRDDWEERVTDIRYSTDDLGAYHMATIDTPHGRIAHTWNRSDRYEDHLVLFFSRGRA